MPKFLYKVFSTYSFIRGLVGRTIGLVVLISALLHYRENPVGITIAVAIIVFILLIIGNDEIYVYSDKIVHTDNSLMAMLLKTSKASYDIKDIKRAYVNEVNPDASEVGFAMLLKFITPRSSGGSNSEIPIYLDLKTGKTVTIVTTVEYDTVVRIVGLVNSLL